jgi:sn-glycerol 3-phosphate transport system permease protein
LRDKTISPKKIITGILTAVTFAALLAAFIFPLFFMLSTSFKTLREAGITPPALIPSSFHPENYAAAWQKMNFPHYLGNSIFITICTIAGQLLVCVPCAYAFAKKQFRFKKFLFAMVLFDLVVPAQVVFLSYYLIESRLGWIDTYRGLVVPFVYSAFTIFFLTQCFKTVPDEILDAAKIDRCSEIQIMTFIMAPMAKPVIIATMLFTFVYKWNDYFWTSILTTSEAVRTIPMAVQNLMPVDHAVREWHIIMTGNVLLFAPMFIIYIFAGKYIKESFMFGGVRKL